MTVRVSITSLLTIGVLAFPQTPLSEPPPALSGPYNRIAWVALEQGLQDSDAAHRRTAIEATGTVGPVPEAVKLVGKALQDKDRVVRQTAAATLGQMGSQEAIPYLKAALDDGPEVSFTAAKALWNLGDTSSRQIFQEVLEGERKDTPGRIQLAMRKAKKRLRPDQLALMGVSEAAGPLLGPGAIGIDAVKEAMKDTGMKDAGIPGRAVAAEVLGKDQDPYALTLLEWALGDSNWAVRVAVCKALGDRGNQETIPKLQPLLSDDRHAVRYMAAASMVKLSLKKQESAAK